jgi:hypothetical protein
MNAIVPDFQSESWEQTGPSYVQTYIVSAFVLMGLLGIAWNGVPFSLTAMLFFSLWFGTAFFWIWQNRRAERTFASDRITVHNGKLTHSFRYTFTEAVHVELDVNRIETIQIHTGELIGVEVVGKSESDFVFLPDPARADRFVQTLRRLNPGIRVID